MENEINPKKFIPAIIAIVIIGVIGFFVWQKSASNQGSNQITQDDSNIILFYGQECPHCQDVEKYIADHQLDQKVQFSRLEVWHDKANSNLLSQKARECGIKTEEVGVPFLWGNGKCYVGVNEVENYLNEQAK